MGRMKLSAAAMEILDAITETFGENELTAEDAEMVFGGSEAVLVKDLNTSQLLQYALLYMAGKAVDATEVAMQKSEEADRFARQILDATRKETNYNRAARRAK